MKNIFKNCFGFFYKETKLNKEHEQQNDYNKEIKNRYPVTEYLCYSSSIN